MIIEHIVQWLFDTLSNDNTLSNSVKNSTKPYNHAYFVAFSKNKKLDKSAVKKLRYRTEEEEKIGLTKYFQK